MANYSYKIVTKEGVLKKGRISAFTKRSAERSLSKDDSIVIFISNTNESFLKKGIDLPWSAFSEIKKINFFRNLSMMNSSGLSIVEALNISLEEIKSDKVKKVIKTMVDGVKNGQKLSKTMAQFPRHFPQFIVETVYMGEISGKFSEALDRIAADLEKNMEIKRKVVNALVYPMIIISAMIVVVVILLVYILPEISRIYTDMGAAMPLPTKILMRISDFLTLNFRVLLLLAFVLMISPFFLLKIKKIHYAFHYLILKVPFLGELIKNYNLVLFFSSIESMIHSGISLISAVDIAGKTINNDVYKKSFNAIRPILLRGVRLSDVLIRFPSLFSIQTRKIIEVGERTGRIEKSFNRITDYYEKLLDYKIRMMTTIIEPVLMLTLGVVVGLMAISVFLPIYQMVNVI